MEILQHHHPLASRKPFGRVDKALMLELIIDSLEDSQKDSLMETADAWHCMAWHTANDNPAQESLLEIDTPH